MKTWWVIAFSVVLALLAAGVLLLVTGAPRGQSIQLIPPPTPGPLVVHVAGEVTNPGVYHLPVGSRVQDAVIAAGGFSPHAEEQALNLAAVLKDGQMLRVPARLQAASPASASGQGAPGSLPGGLLDINTATAADLEALPEIGPVLAQRIVDYRQANGPFASVEHLLEVPGIGEGIFAAVEDLVTAGGVP